MFRHQRNDDLKMDSFPKFIPKHQQYHGEKFKKMPPTTLEVNLLVLLKTNFRSNKTFCQPWWQNRRDTEWLEINITLRMQCMYHVSKSSPKTRLENYTLFRVIAGCAYSFLIRRTKETFGS